MSVSYQIDHTGRGISRPCSYMCVENGWKARPDNPFTEK